MRHNAAFHQGLPFLLRQNRSSKKEYNILLEIIICDPSIYKMDHPNLIVSNFIENSIDPKRDKTATIFNDGGIH